jgi:hypothetical protein
MYSKICKIRYQEAKDKHDAIAYPSATRDFGTIKAKFPDINTAGGLTLFIVNFLNWSGHNATRISSAGRVLNGRYIYGQTRKGTADITSTIKGRSVKIEIKVGKDKPSPHQLKEQIKERAAGGCYEFISTPEQFFEWYDGFVNSIL